MSMTSYAENFEDALLWRALGHVERGFYIDVGAAAPTQGSLTCVFYEQGWQGVNVEPAKSHHRRLQLARPADINLMCALGPTDGRSAFYEVPDSSLSTIDPSLARSYRDSGREVLQREVDLTTLNQLCTAHAPAVIHLLNIDTGGGEEAVLEGLDLQHWRPWVIVLNRPTSVPLLRLLTAGYQLAQADGWNHFYVANEKSELKAKLTLPAHPNDGFVLCEAHPRAWPLDAWHARLARAELAVADARVAVDDMRQRVQKADEAAEKTMQWAANHEREQRQAVERLTAELAAMTTHARAAEATLEGTYASLSWRLTRPLRESKRQLLRTARYARRTPSRVRGLGVRVAKGALRQCLHYVTARPALSFFLRRTAARLPFLVPLLRSFKMRIEANQRAAAGGMLPGAPSDLPDAARQVLADLRRHTTHF